MPRSASIETYMSPLTVTIGAEQPMAEAAARMREHHIRHVPVLHGGHLVGILSDRDLAMVESLPGVDPQKVIVREAMTPDPYAVGRDARVAEVVAQMAEHKYGTTVIVEGDRPVGIFTTVDALRLCATLLGEPNAVS
jgi:acetoin utilization protein AcuB